MTPPLRLWLSRLLPLAAALMVGWLGVQAAQTVWTEGTTRKALQASDALPVYLSAVAVMDGGDPTRQEDLKAAYDSRKVVARAAVFSNLYPASTGVLAQPLATGTYDEFIWLWRRLLMLGAVLAGACAGWASVRGRGAAVGAALGLWVATAGFPVTGECISLGQANLLVGGLMAVAMLGLDRGWTWLAVVAGVLGGGIKLVPGAIFAPMLGAWRWRSLLLGAVLGLGLAGLTLQSVPLERVISGVRATLQFQGTISPDWLNDVDAPDWVVFVGDWRHRGTALLTGLFVLLASFSTARGGDEQATRRVMAGSVALVSAWLGADAAAFHVLYAPLYIPAAAWLATWPLDRRAPWWSWLGPLLAALPWLSLDSPLTEVSDTFALTVAGLGLWAGCLVRLLGDSRRLPLLGWPLIGLAAGYGAAWGDVFNERPLGPAPEAVGGNVEGYGLPEGVGWGGPAPGTDVLDPEQAAAIAELRERPSKDSLDGTRLERVLAPEAAQRLTGHLNQGPLRWAEVDDPLGQALSVEAPPPPAAHALYGEVALWMARERYAGLSLEVEGVKAARSELERTLQVMGRFEQQ